MDNINLDDYYTSMVYIYNLPDKDVDKWISTGSSGKILKKMNKLYKSGGSFISNAYEVTSTDPTLQPFMYYNGTKHIIEYVETRFINYFPSLSDLSDITKMKNETADLDISKELGKNSKKRNFTEFNKDLKNESISQKVKKRRVDEKNNSDDISDVKTKKLKKKKKIIIEEKMSTLTPIKSEPVIKKKDNFISPESEICKVDENNNSDDICDVTTKKHKKKKKIIIEEKMSTLTPIKSEPVIKKRNDFISPESEMCKVDENNISDKSRCTNNINDCTTKKLKKKKKSNTEENRSTEIQIKLEATVKNKKSINNQALDTSIVKTESSVQECEIPKKSKSKSHPLVAEVKTEPVEIPYHIHKEAEQITTNIKCEPEEYYNISSKLYNANDVSVKRQKHKKKVSETEMILDIKKEKVKKSKKH